MKEIHEEDIKQYQEIWKEIQRKVDATVVANQKIEINRKINPDELREKFFNEIFDEFEKIVGKQLASASGSIKELQISHQNILNAIEARFKGAVSERQFVKMPTMEEARKMMEALLTEEEAEQVFSIGLDHLSENRFDKAIQFFNFLLLFYPRNGELWARKGYVEDQMGQHDEALVSYTTLFSLPLESTSVLTYATSYLNFVDLLIRMERGKEVKEIFEEFLRALPPGFLQEHAALHQQTMLLKNYFDNQTVL